MKKILVFLCLVSLGFVPAPAASPATPPSPPAPAPGGLRYTIGVTKFENHAKYAGPLALADCWSAVLTDSLFRTGRFIVLGEGDLRTAALGEQDLAKAGRTAAGSVAPVTGALTPAQILVKGEITHFQEGTSTGGGKIGMAGLNLGFSGSTSEVNAIVYMIDTSTGQVIASKKVTGTAKSSGVTVGVDRAKWNGDLGSFKSTNVGHAFEQAIDEAVAFCTAQLPHLRWSGEVILVRDGQLYINRGEREGVTAGQVFQVGQAEILRDPGTGEVLDVNFTVSGQIRVESVREKLSICRVITGTGLEKGMTVTPL